MKSRVVLFILLAIAMPMVAKFHQVTSQKSFEKSINDYPYAIVCFAKSGPDGDEELTKEEKKEVKGDFRDFRRRIKGAADSKKYKEYLKKDVGFLLVDITSGRAEEIDDDYDLNNFPTCILFKNGKPVSHMASYAQIFDPISKSSILTLLEKHFKNELAGLIEEKKEEERLEREERIARYEAYSRYGGPYGYWGWGGGPYYGYYGWGHRPWYGWGYGYRRYC